MNISKHYLDDRGRNYFQKGFGPDKAAGRLLQAEYFLPFCREELVLLDFGCADGLFLRNLPAKRRIGVEAIAEARERNVVEIYAYWRVAPLTSFNPWRRLKVPAWIS